jgi:hypothetical protein
MEVFYLDGDTQESFWDGEDQLEISGQEWKRWFEMIEKLDRYKLNLPRCSNERLVAGVVIQV